jgi:thiamine pyrophosphate-dependent acetolactate synthase large subunit-like protein
MGYGAGAAVGAALANKKHGRISINVQTDGDLNYAPAVLWTAAHHKAPLLTIMHNNRGYHQEVMRLQRQATVMNRGADYGIPKLITRASSKDTGCTPKDPSAIPRIWPPRTNAALNV